MEKELQEIEGALRGLSPAKLGSDLQDRIEEIMSPLTSTDSTGGLEGISLEVSRTAPVALRPELVAELESILSVVPHPNTRKVLSFPETGRAEPPRRAWRNYAAAASVAVLGALAAFMVPANEQAEPRIAGGVEDVGTASTSLAESLVPANYRANLRDASDEGIVWQNGSAPQRMLKLVYMEQVTLKDAEGREIQVERPRVRYIMVPARLD